MLNVIKRLLIFSYGGSTILKPYGFSLYKALRSVYPHHQWESWKFCAVVKGYFDNDKNIIKFLNSIAKELDIKSINDW